MTLTEFLLARIVEDEAEAREMGVIEYYEGGWTEAHEEKVLAECEAKRRIVREHGPEDADPTLQALALPYADHPDFREEWKP